VSRFACDRQPPPRTPQVEALLRQASRLEQVLDVLGQPGPETDRPRGPNTTPSRSGRPRRAAAGAARVVGDGAGRHEGIPGSRSPPGAIPRGSAAPVSRHRDREAGLAARPWGFLGSCGSEAGMAQTQGPSQGHSIPVARPQPVRRLRRVQAARPPVQPREMLARRRLADAELVGRGGDGAGSEVRPQDLELPPRRTLLGHQPALRSTTGHILAGLVTFSSTNRGRNRRWVKLALPLSPRPNSPKSSLKTSGNAARSPSSTASGVSS
jgi:hypothetical protein